MTTTEPTTRVTLDVDLCSERVCTTITFRSGDDAIAYLSRNSHRVDVHEIVPEVRYFGRGAGQIEWVDPDVTPSIAFGPQTPDIERLIDRLYPQCDHGLALDLCMGPDHYPTYEQERAMGW